MDVCASELDLNMLVVWASELLPACVEVCAPDVDPTADVVAASVVLPACVVVPASLLVCPTLDVCHCVDV